MYQWNSQEAFHWIGGHWAHVISFNVQVFIWQRSGRLTATANSLSRSPASFSCPFDVIFVSLTSSVTWRDVHALERIAAQTPSKAPLINLAVAMNYLIRLNWFEWIQFDLLIDLIRWAVDLVGVMYRPRRHSTPMAPSRTIFVCWMLINSVAMATDIDGE